MTKIMKNLRKIIQFLANLEEQYIITEDRSRKYKEQRGMGNTTPEEKFRHFENTPIHERELEKYINPTKSYWQKRYYKALFMEAMKTMQLQQKQMLDMVPLIGSNNNNTTNNNNFNLQLFLNDTCKDALNITDFLNSLQVQLKDLEYTTDNGHVNGITNIFKTALCNMEETKRPMHCTDLKREVLYIKDNDEWSKENDSKEALKGLVYKVSNKNCRNIKKI